MAGMTLDEYAKQIIVSHETVLDCKRLADKKAVQAAIACGQNLIAAKKMVKHGEWLPWLVHHCKGIGERTAEKYMKLANPNHSADLAKAVSLRQAYIVAGVISKGGKATTPEPSNFVKAKGLAVQLWNLLIGTTDQERMAKEIEPILQWHQDYLERKQKREASLNDGFDAKETKLAIETTDESETGFECNSCGETFADDSEAVSLYECAECGNTFTRETSANDNHQCPDCNKFGSKISDMGCPSCNDGELEEIGIVSNDKTEK